ncbi:hypothetical protein BN996_03927 [Haloferax massiliensis]|uniref:Uncharacterized protein n=1 Tax=Haloferax massiliensis TaxID=1476858 RepID=A0A0D6JX19_9EURY|nr:hypothetical protein BN996_03927 [Haloferax massiliensis]
MAGRPALVGEGGDGVAEVGPQAGVRVAVDKAEPAVHEVREAGHPVGVAGGDDEPPLAGPRAKFDRVDAVRGVAPVARDDGHVGDAVSEPPQTLAGAEREIPWRRHAVEDARERGVVLADAEQLRRANVGREQLDRHRLALREILHVGRDLDDAVGLDEARRRARPLIDGVDERVPVAVGDESDRHEPRPSLGVPLAGGHRPLDRRGPGLREARGVADRRCDERPEDGERGDRIARQTDVGAPLAERADEHGFPGLDGDAVQQEFTALFDHAVDDVDRARGRRPRREHEVALVGRPPEQALHLLVVVARVGVERRDAAGLLDPRGDGVGVHVVDFARLGSQFVARPDELVAGRDDAHGRFPADRHLVDAERRQQADFAGRQARAGAERASAGGDVGPGGHHAVAGRDRRVDDERAVSLLGSLHDDDGVRARRHHRAGGDFDGGPGSDRHVRFVAGVDRPDEVEFDRLRLVSAEGVAGADRVAVHARAVEAGHVEFGVDSLGEDAAAGVFERDGLGVGRQVERRDGLAGVLRGGEVAELLSHADHSQPSTATVSPSS